MSSDVIDAETHDELTAKVLKCQDELQVYLSLLSRKKSKLRTFRDIVHPGGAVEDSYIGGREGLAMKYALASCDKNGDGKITEEELEKLQHNSANILSEQTEAQMNAGLVAALILSFLVPLSLEPIKESDDCVEFFGQDTVKYLKIVSIFLTLLANASCIVTILLAVRLGVYVNWITSTHGRTLYVSTIDASLFPRLQLGTLAALQFVMIARGALAGPLQGLAGIITYIIYQGHLMWYDNSAGARAHGIQLKLVKDMMASKGKSGSFPSNIESWS